MPLFQVINIAYETNIFVKCYQIHVIILYFLSMQVNEEGVTRVLQVNIICAYLEG